MTKCVREVMEILETYNLTQCAHSAAELAGCEEKTVARYVELCDAGHVHFIGKIEELVEASQPNPGGHGARQAHRDGLRRHRPHTHIPTYPPRGLPSPRRSTRPGTSPKVSAWGMSHAVGRIRSWACGREFDWGEGLRGE